MTLIHIYDKETGKFMRSQEPKLDILETEKQGHPVYVTYANSTDVALPEYGEHELPFWNTELSEWEIKGQYKNLEVYNKDTKTFDYCYTDELAENQVFIDDKEGIENFKKNYEMYIVDEETWTIIPNPKYDLILQLRDLKEQFANTDTAYQAALETPVEFPLNHHLYKARWVDDSTYTKILTGAMAGVITFPINIWDATKLAENMVSMDQATFGQLVGFLAQIQNTAFETRKYAQSVLLPQIQELEKEIYGEVQTLPQN